MSSLILRSFNIYLLSSYHVPGTALGAGNTLDKETQPNPGSWLSSLPFPPAPKPSLFSQFPPLPQWSHLFVRALGVRIIKLLINQVWPWWPREYKRFLIRGFMNPETVCKIWCLCVQFCTECPTFYYIFHFFKHYNFFFKDFIYLFLEREEGKEKERERDISVWFPLTCPLLGTWPATQVCALTGNWTSDPLLHRPVLNPLNHTSQGHILHKSEKTLTFVV